MGKPDKSLEEILDLDGNGRIAAYVGRFEDLYRQRKAVTDDLKSLADEAFTDGMLLKREVEAVKRIAKWRLDDKLGAAQELFGAMRKVSAAIKVSLFDWAASEK